MTSDLYLTFPIFLRALLREERSYECCPGMLYVSLQPNLLFIKGLLYVVSEFDEGYFDEGCSE